MYTNRKLTNFFTVESGKFLYVECTQCSVSASSKIIVATVLLQRHQSAVNIATETLPALYLVMRVIKSHFFCGSMNSQGAFPGLEETGGLAWTSVCLSVSLSV